MFHTDSLYLLMFGSGLLGGFGHCIGMCGPIVATYSLGLKRRGVAPHLLYNLGRIATYSILGGFIGLTGSFAGVVKPIERFQSVTLAFAGAIMIIMGLSLAGWIPFLTGRGQKTYESGQEAASPRSRFSHNLVLFLNRAVKLIAGTKSAGAYFPMGLVLGFLPCGLLYTAFIAAAGAGAGAADHGEGFLKGMLLLSLFGLGTAPAMFLLGRIVSLRSEWLRSRFYKGSAVIMIVIGIMFVYRAFR